MYEAVLEQGININFNKQTKLLMRIDKSNKIDFSDGSNCYAQILFSIDSLKSLIRKVVIGRSYKLSYTGSICITGIVNDLSAE